MIDICRYVLFCVLCVYSDDLLCIGIIKFDYFVVESVVCNVLPSLLLLYL